MASTSRDIKSPVRPGLGITTLLAPVTSFYALFLILPYTYILWLSFTRYSSTLLFEPTFTLENYAAILTDTYYLSLLGKTIGLGLFVTIVTLLMGYPLAMKIVRSSPTVKAILLILVMTPLLVNVVVRTYAWLVLLGDKGVINQSLIAIGLIDSPLPINRNFISVALGLIHLSLPLMVLSLVSIMQKLDHLLVEAGESLGAGPLRILVKLHFPLCLPGVGTGCLLVFCTVISAFVTPQLLGGNQFSTISTVIYQKFTFTMNWPVGATLVFILLALNFTVILFHGYLFKER
ncbi:MAG: ABC transporter permease [Gemmobacter sp.]|jgi:putative spermidine/putrescine transport system permease protein|nr:ABC transporter permease [Gemmobacter sp.]